MTTADTLNAAADIKVGDVVTYVPEPRFPGQVDVRHCREGMAIASRWSDGVVRLLDTYWSMGGDDHVLTRSEMASVEVLFNLADYDEIDRYRKTSEQWLKFAKRDRQRVTSQHGLQSRWFIRKGAREDLHTQVENAAARLAAAEDELDSAQRRVTWARDDLAALRAAAHAEQEEER